MMPRSIRKNKSSMGVRSKQQVKATSLNSAVDPPSAFSILSEDFESYDAFLISLNTYYDYKKQKMDLLYEETCKNVMMMFSKKLQELPEHIRLLHVNVEIDEDADDENNNLNGAVTSSSKCSTFQKLTETLKSKELSTNRGSSRKRLPFVTQKHGVPAEDYKDCEDENNYLNGAGSSSDSLRSQKLTEALKLKETSKATSSSGKRLPPVTQSPIVSASGWKTPLSRMKFLPGTTITPKINNSPICVIRRPLQGEMAVSMDGSPLMVGVTSRDDIPTVNVPLEDGRIFSIMPEAGAHPDDLPKFDDATKQYLITLRKHLEIIAPNNP